MDENPSKLVNLYSVHQYIAAVRWAIRYRPEAAKQRIERLAVILDEAMAKSDGGGMHKFHLFLLSEVYDVARPNGTAKMSKLIADRLSAPMISFHFQSEHVFVQNLEHFYILNMASLLKELS